MGIIIEEYFLQETRFLVINTILSYLLILIPVLLNVAFITLLERKILAFSQLRVGPNKVAWAGSLQPIADAVKLFVNQVEGPFSRNFYIYLWSPILRLSLVLIIWGTLPISLGNFSFKYRIIVILLIIRFGVYPLLLSGWSSNRKYALLGSLRGVAQTISYEISLSLIMMVFLLYLKSYELEEIIYNSHVSMVAVLPIICIMWLISSIAETNRTPFDFSEGESELVSGFNIEYGSGVFAVIFIAEYGRIYFLRILRASLFIGTTGESIRSNFLVIFIVFFWVWARSTLPRFRYDLLINLAWKELLPISLGVVEMSTLIFYF